MLHSRIMPPPDPISLWRRLGCILYDLVVLIALWWAASLPLAMVDLTVPGSPERLLYQLWLAAVGAGYFVVSWRTRGATIGMRAWRVRVETLDGHTPGWGTAAIRMLAAGVSWLCLGAGFLWSLFSADRLCWHDRWSATRLVAIK